MLQRTSPQFGNSALTKVARNCSGICNASTGEDSRLSSMFAKRICPSRLSNASFLVKMPLFKPENFDQRGCG